MSKIKLKDVVFYSKERIPHGKLKLESYVSTENLLQNKLGVTRINALPASINNTTKYSAGNILISNIRPYLKKIWYAKNEGGVSSDVLTLIVKNDFDSRFVYYNLFQDEFFDHMMSGSKGTKMPRGDKNQILEFEIPNLEFPIQEKIASVLSALDDKIELNNKVNTELEAMAKTLYDYWFVQFDFPDANGKPYKSSGGKMIWNEALKREIPEGWEVRSLGNYANIKKGTLITEKTANTEGSIKVVSAGLDYSYFHDKPNYPENTITISASGASAGFINFWREPIFACDCTTVRGNDDIETLYTLHFLKMLQEHIFKQARGSAQPHVYPKDIEVLTLAVPPTHLLKKYGDLVMSGNEKISVNLKQNQKLAQLRDWLLPMLMNGQVTVGEAEEKMGMVAEKREFYCKNS